MTQIERMNFKENRTEVKFLPLDCTAKKFKLMILSIKKPRTSKSVAMGRLFNISFVGLIRICSDSSFAEGIRRYDVKICFFSLEKLINMTKFNQFENIPESETT